MADDEDEKGNSASEQTKKDMGKDAQKLANDMVDNRPKDAEEILGKEMAENKSLARQILERTFLAAFLYKEEQRENDRTGPSK